MKPLLIISLFVIGLYSCNQPSSKKSYQISNEEGKSRIDQVKELPYRHMEIGSSLENIVRSDLEILSSLVDLSKPNQLFWKSDAGVISEVDHQCSTFQKLLYYSYDYWKNNPVKYTCIFYPSSSQDAVTGAIDSFFVYQIEHAKLTGTIRVFVESPDDSEFLEISYQERN